MVKRNCNSVMRLFDREIGAVPRGASRNYRKFYENIVPNNVVYDVQSPNLTYCKFSDDGEYLIAFNKRLNNLNVYRPKWYSHSYKDEDDILPRSATKFENFFTLLYSVPITPLGELIYYDFFVYLKEYHYGIFATYTSPSEYDGFISFTLMPYSETTTFHIVNLKTGAKLDTKILVDDFVLLGNNTGVHVYEDLMVIVSLRHQMIHLVRITPSGRFVDVARIGEIIQEEDDAFVQQTLSRFANADFLPDMLFTGLNTRLMSFLYKTARDEVADERLREQKLKRKFYRFFEYYSQLVVAKVQFIDREHLLVKFGSGRAPESSGGYKRHPCCFGVYNIQKNEFVSYYKDWNEAMFAFFERNCDHFYATTRHVNSLDPVKRARKKAKVLKKAVNYWPVNCQSLSPSPYFDTSLFLYNEKLITAMEWHRQPTGRPIRFRSRRQPRRLKFKIMQSRNTFAGTKTLYSLLFHPHWPLILSIQSTYNSINIHFRS